MLDLRSNVQKANVFNAFIQSKEQQQDSGAKLIGIQIQSDGNPKAGYNSMLNKISAKKKQSERSKDRSADSKLEQSAGKHLQDQAVEIIKSTLIKMSSSNLNELTEQDHKQKHSSLFLDEGNVEELNEVITSGSCS